MSVVGPKLETSASDLSNHLACRHLTQLDRAVAESRIKPPAWRDPAVELLQERGRAHQQSYVEGLRANGLRIVDLRDFDGVAASDRMSGAMYEGVDAIVQAELRDGRWVGRADVLLRVPEASDLGRHRR
jgi:uncharacterized protein